MADVTWTDQALEDLEAVCLYIARDAPRYAEMFARRVFQATDRLVTFPQLGRVVPEIGRDDIREVIVQRYHKCRKAQSFQGGDRRHLAQRANRFLLRCSRFVKTFCHHVQCLFRVATLANRLYLLCPTRL